MEKLCGLATLNTVKLNECKYSFSVSDRRTVWITVCSLNFKGKIMTGNHFRECRLSVNFTKNYSVV